LMEAAGHEQRKVVKSELAQVKRAKHELHRLAKSAHTHKTKLMQQQAHGHSAAKMTMAALAKASIRSERKFAASAAHLARDGHRILKDMHTAESEIASAIGSKDASVAAEVEGLMEKAAHMQVRNVRREIAEVKHSRHEIRKFEKVERRHGRTSFAQEVAGTGMKMALRRRALGLKKLARREQKLTKDSRHLLHETSNAQRAIEAELGNTKEGAEIARLLGQAQKKAKRIVGDDRKSVELVNEDERSVKKLAAELR